MAGENNSRRSCCCSGEAEPLIEIQPGGLGANAQKQISAVGTTLTWAERCSGWLVRWGIGRARYRIAPGLYAVGNPDGQSVVLVTANYKLSFDALRKELDNLSAWILVLDTKGINVWCAAGKGTFGTDELVRRIDISELHKIVTHRALVLPQLGAPGVAAYKVKQQTGFNVLYGPVRARDLKAFLANGMKATTDMRTVNFGLAERLAVVPVELVEVLKYFLAFLVALTLWSLIRGKMTTSGFWADSFPVLGAMLTGTVVTPALLPWIPFRSFALKGWLVGILWALGISLAQKASLMQLAGNLLLLPAISAYLALNFTGSTTFTSQTGVNKEIRLFARPMAISGILGILLLAAQLFG